MDSEQCCFNFNLTVAGVKEDILDLRSEIGWFYRISDCLMAKLFLSDNHLKSTQSQYEPHCERIRRSQNETFLNQLHVF